VLVDVRYHDTPTAALDAAVLVMSDPIPGPSATLGTRILPMASLLELLENQADYLHIPEQDWQPVTTVHVTRS
jgi:hypothetical protein